jgi:hypothetical protein
VTLSSIGTADFSRAGISIHDGVPTLKAPGKNPADTGYRNSSLQRGVVVSSDVIMYNCTIGSVGSNTGYSTGVYVTSGSSLETVNVSVESGGSSLDNRGIYVWDTGTSALLQVTKVDCDGSALIVLDSGPLVLTYYSYFEGSTALSTSGATNIHTASGFLGTRTGFTAGVDAWFAQCYTLDAGAPQPLTDTLSAVAP